jgi:hypothetical protein
MNHEVYFGDSLCFLCEELKSARGYDCSRPFN